MNIHEIADAYRELHRLVTGKASLNEEPPVAISARQALGVNNEVVMDFELLRTGDEAHLAAVQALLGIDPGGTPTLAAILQADTDAGSQPITNLSDIQVTASVDFTAANLSLKPSSTDQDPATSTPAGWFQIRMSGGDFAVPYYTKPA